MQDLYLNTLHNADESDLECFFSKTLGSKYFNASYICRYRAEDGQMCRHWTRVNRTDSVWVGIIRDDQNSWVYHLYDLIQEELVTADDILARRVRGSWDNYRKMHPGDKMFDINDIDVIISFILDHTGTQLFFTTEG